MRLWSQGTMHSAIIEQSNLCDHCRTWSVSGSKVPSKPSDPYLHPPERVTQACRQWGMSAPDAGYNFEQTSGVYVARKISHVEYAYGYPQYHLQTQQGYQDQQETNFTCESSLGSFAFDCPGSHQAHVQGLNDYTCVPVKMVHRTPIYPRTQPYNLESSPTQLLAQGYHHHHLLDIPSPSRFRWSSCDFGIATSEGRGLSPYVGQPGVPKPATESRGLKLSCTPEDDALLVKLKETKDLT
jgi:hypothetical protein